VADAKLFYKSEQTSKTRSEAFAQEILDNRISELHLIQKITRQSSYNVGHTSKTERETSNREEERIALELFGKSFPHLGTILDYQVPLKNIRADIGHGKIDLISCNNEKQNLTLLELKKPNSNETLLRATLEIFTYWKIIDHPKVLGDFHLSQNTNVKKAVMLFQDSYAYSEYVSRKSPNTIALMQALNVDFWGIREASDGYEVFVP
jgi:hypothetical protein